MLLKIGTPCSYRGYTSALYPLLEYWPAPKRERYLSKTILTIGAPSPVCPNPSNCVLPRSLSNAATWFFNSLAWSKAYWAAPSI